MSAYTDRRFKNFEWIVGSIQNENERQLLKWGIQTHSPFKWLTFTTEELGELAKAISEYEDRDGTKEEVVKEAIQVATLALKIAEMFHEV